VTNVYGDGTKEEYDYVHEITILSLVAGLAFGGGLIRASLGVLLNPPSTSGLHDGGTHFSFALVLRDEVVRYFSLLVPVFYAAYLPR